MAADGILVLNAGSSSLKFALYVLDDSGVPEARYRGLLDGFGHQPKLTVRSMPDGASESPEIPSDVDHARALALVLDWLEARLSGVRLAAAGHRVVHGGPKHHRPLPIDDALLAELEALCPLAPLHQPHNLAAIRAIRQLRPKLPQVACFDTAFHRTQPLVAQRFALPEEYADRGILRYGFHGLSYEYIAARLAEYDAEAAAGRVVIAHLGNGASMCGVRAGESVATTMGFTALDGLPMGQRCGSIDPGVLLHLLQHDGMSADALSDLLYRRSGLLGVSGISSDMRALLASDDPAAARAVELFCYRAQREIGSLAAALGGLDAVVFTGGIGENAAPVRAGICLGLDWLGLEFDDDANARRGPSISRRGSRVRAWVIPTDEESVIVRHTIRLALRNAPSLS